MKGREVNLSRMLFHMTNSIVCRAVFGSKCRATEEFVSTMNELVKYGTGFALADLFPSLKFLSVLTGFKPALRCLFDRLDKTLCDIIDGHVHYYKYYFPVRKTFGCDFSHPKVAPINPKVKMKMKFMYP